MKRILFLLWIVALGIASATVITDLRIGKNPRTDSRGDYLVDPTSVFSPTVPKIGITFHYEDATTPGNLEVRWIAVDAISVPDYLITRQELPLNDKAGEGYAFLERGPKPFPPGHYRVEIYEQEKKLAEKNFSIAGTQMKKADKATSGKQIPPLLIAGSVQEGSDGQLIPEEVNNRFSVKRHLLYAIFSYHDRQPGEPFRFEWFYLGSGGAQQPVLLAKIEGKLDRKNGAIPAHITLDRDWPTGEYLVRVYLGDTQVAETRYTMY